jgi:hypothetical protein
MSRDDCVYAEASDVRNNTVIVKTVYNDWYIGPSDRVDSSSEFDSAERSLMFRQCGYRRFNAVNRVHFMVSIHTTTIYIAPPTNADFMFYFYLNEIICSNLQLQLNLLPLPTWFHHTIISRSFSRYIYQSSQQNLSKIDHCLVKSQ